MTVRPPTRRCAVPAAALLATTILVLSGCTSPGGGADAAPAGPPLAGPGRLVVATCEQWAAPSPTMADGKVHVVTVTALSATDGREEASRIATLPDRATSATLCEPTLSATVSATADRQAFNADFSLIAGTLAPSEGAMKRAAAFTLPGGQAGSTAPADGPGEDRRPLFQEGSSVLWYETAGRKLTSRDLAVHGADPVIRGTAPGEDFALHGDRPWLGRPFDTKAEGISVAPGGEVAAGYAQQHAVLWRADQVAGDADGIVEPLVLGAATPGYQAVPGSEQVPLGCFPRLWLDGRQLLCGTRDNLYRVGFAADFGRVEGVAALLPAEKQFVSGAVLSPDGKALAYLSAVDGIESIHRIDLVPDAVPVKLVELRPPAAAADDPSNGLPHLVAWL
ncbi:MULTISPECIES: hypothetical protein [unclassified Kitasatospora]|uniref:hypothetical protein n=1 Tax=unclassified Kitasatospora TaxID=2633591 RepID=UPI000B21B178|nr:MULTISPECIES: hypothetical protein [unclassified Kitasatospora]